MAAILPRLASSEHSDHAVEADASIAHIGAVDSSCIYNGPYPQGWHVIHLGAGRAACSKPSADELSRVAKPSSFMPGHAPAAARPRHNQRWTEGVGDGLAAPHAAWRLGCC